jgi:menaquinone-dependent protoporphyrinogen IX oxidase
VFRLEKVTSLASYRGVVIGAPLILGWHQAALRFNKKHEAELSKVPVAYFITAMSLTDSGAASVDGVPFTSDPHLPKAPKNPSRLGIKERYALPENYLRPILRAAPSVRPVRIVFLGGKLAYYLLKWWQSLFVLVFIQAKPGGSFNKTFIREWAADVLGEFEGV